MKIIKRDGRAVDYNREKIEIAIEKANKEVRPKERATKEEIKSIIKPIKINQNSIFLLINLTNSLKLYPIVNKFK